MTAEIIQFIPRANHKSDRAFWKGPSSPELDNLGLEIANEVFGTTTLCGGSACSVI